MLEEMGRRELLPDSITCLGRLNSSLLVKKRLSLRFNSAISSCSRADRWHNSLDLLARMAIERPRPTEFSYGAAMDGLSGEGLWVNALALLCEVSQVELRRNVVIMGAAVAACDKAGKWQEALLLLEEDRLLGKRMCFECLSIYIYNYIYISLRPYKRYLH